MGVIIRHDGVRGKVGEPPYAGVGHATGLRCRQVLVATAAAGRRISTGPCDWQDTAFSGYMRKPHWKPA